MKHKITLIAAFIYFSGIILLIGMEIYDRWKDDPCTTLVDIWEMDE